VAFASKIITKSLEKDGWFKSRMVDRKGPVIGFSRKWLEEKGYL
jgi:hypothetical protein